MLVFISKSMHSADICNELELLVCLLSGFIKIYSGNFEMLFNYQQCFFLLKAIIES